MKTPKYKNQKSSVQKIIDQIDGVYPYCSGVDYDSNSYYPCNNGSSCCDGDMCRCRIVQDARIVSVNLNEVIKFFSCECNGEDILIYCLDRILRIYEAWNTQNWEVIINRGYYGEEIHGTELEKDIKSRVISFLKEIEPLSDADKIKKCLEYEYGFVLPSLSTLKEVSLISVPLKNILLQNDNYAHKLSRKALEEYKTFPLAMAVCVKVNGTRNYSIIDGYHRITSAKNQNIEKVPILVFQ